MRIIEFFIFVVKNMEIDTSIEKQRTIKFYPDYRIKKPKKKNDSVTIYKLYSLKHFTLRPTGNLLLNARISSILIEVMSTLFFFKYKI